MLTKLLQSLTPEIVAVLAVSQVFGIIALLLVIFLGYKLVKQYLKENTEVQREMAQSISESKQAISNLSNFLDGLIKGRGVG